MWSLQVQFTELRSQTHSSWIRQEWNQLRQTHPMDRSCQNIQSKTWGLKNSEGRKAGMLSIEVYSYSYVLLYSKKNITFSCFCSQFAMTMTIFTRIVLHSCLLSAGPGSTLCSGQCVSWETLVLAAVAHQSSPAPFRTIGQLWNRPRCFDSQCLQCRSTLHSY